MKYLNRKFQQGGAAPQNNGEANGGEQEMVQQIAQALQQGAKPEEVLQALVQQGMEQGQAAQLIQGIMQQLGGTPSAKNGAKLEYIKRLQSGGVTDRSSAYKAYANQTKPKVATNTGSFWKNTGNTLSDIWNDSKGTPGYKYKTQYWADARNQPTTTKRWTRPDNMEPYKIAVTPEDVRGDYWLDTSPKILQPIPGNYPVKKETTPTSNTPKTKQYLTKPIPTEIANTDKDIRAMQQVLVDSGLLAKPKIGKAVDGIWGKNSQAAYEKYKANKLALNRATNDNAPFVEARQGFPTSLKHGGYLVNKKEKGGETWASNNVGTGSKSMNPADWKKSKEEIAFNKKRDNDAAQERMKPKSLKVNMEIVPIKKKEKGGFLKKVAVETGKTKEYKRTEVLPVGKKGMKSKTKKCEKGCGCKKTMLHKNGGTLSTVCACCGSFCN